MFIFHTNLLMLQWRTMKVRMNRTNLVCSIFPQTWYRTFVSETQNCARYDEGFANHRAARSETKCVVHTDSSLELVRACQDLCWNHNQSSPNHSETNAIAEHALIRVKRRDFGTSALVRFLRHVAERSGGMLLLFAEHTRQIGRETMKEELELYMMVWWCHSGAEIYVCNLYERQKVVFINFGQSCFQEDASDTL